MTPLTYLTADKHSHLHVNSSIGTTLPEGLYYVCIYVLCFCSLHNYNVCAFPIELKAWESTNNHLFLLVLILHKFQANIITLKLWIIVLHFVTTNLLNQLLIKVDYHANENPLKNVEKIAYVCQSLMYSIIKKNMILYYASFFNAFSFLGFYIKNSSF